MAKKFEVTMVKGFSRASESQIRTMMALGLKKRHKSVVIEDNNANRGQVLKVQHLVSVKVLE